MIHVSEVMTTVPEVFKTELNEKIYTALTALGIPFERVENDETLTMEDCEAIDRQLAVHTAKTLFLCNRQKTSFYLFVTRGNKPFVTKDFSKALGISRVSFASEEALMELLSVQPGAATLFSLLLDSAESVQAVVDSEVAAQEYVGVTDGTRTGYLKLKTADLLRVFLPYTRHDCRVIEV